MNKEAERSQRRALGKGLSALLPTRSTAASSSNVESSPAASAAKQELPEHFEEFQNIPLEQIQPSGEQPRDSFDAEKLEELAHSIQANGLIQPITVYRTGEGSYKLIAGERRWKAASIAGLKEIPALVRSVERDQVLQLALIENIQREDLNPIEIAAAFQRLMTEHGFTHEQVAERTGKDRSTVTNFVRLLRLSSPVRQALIHGSITVGHGRALLNITDPAAQAEACDQVIEEHLSVRETEALVKELTNPEAQHPTKNKNKEDAPLDPNVRAALDDMARVLGTKVRMVSKSGKAGRLEVEFYSQDDLDRIYAAIVRQ